MKYFLSLLALLMGLPVMAQPVAVKSTNGNAYGLTVNNQTNTDLTASKIILTGTGKKLISSAYGESDLAAAIAYTNWIATLNGLGTNTTIRSNLVVNGDLHAGGLGGGGSAERDFYVDSTNKTVYLGRLSSTSSDNSTVVIRNRLDAAIMYASTGGSGLVGFGLTNPATTVHIVSQSASSEVRIGNTNSGAFSRLSLVGDPTTFNWLIAEQNNISGLEITPSTAVGGLTFSTPAVAILPASGFVGIGLSAPQATLHVMGNEIVQTNLQVGGTINATNVINARGGFISYAGSTNYGSTAQTNAVVVGTFGLIASNGSGGVTLSGGKITATGTGQGITLAPASAADTYLTVLNNLGANRVTFGWVSSSDLGFLGNLAAPFMTWDTSSQAVVKFPTTATTIFSGGVTATNGFGSYATDATVNITSTGYTNTFGKTVIVYLDGTAVTFSVKNSAGTSVYTNAVSLTGEATVILQPGGAVIASGTGVTGRATPW